MAPWHPRTAAILLSPMRNCASLLAAASAPNWSVSGQYVSLFGFAEGTQIWKNYTSSRFPSHGGFHQWENRPSPAQQSCGLYQNHSKAWPIAPIFRPAALLRSTNPFSLSRHGFAAAWRQDRGGAGPPVINNGHGGFPIAVFHHHRVGVMPQAGDSNIYRMALFHDLSSGIGQAKKGACFNQLIHHRSECSLLCMALHLMGKSQQESVWHTLISCCIISTHLQVCLELYTHVYSALSVGSRVISSNVTYCVIHICRL